MKKLLLFFSIIFLSVQLWAEPIDSVQAISFAKQFFSSNSSRAMRVPVSNNFKLAYVNKGMNNHPHFYIYNIGDNNGFVIVSADTRVKTILGYSDTGNFNSTNMPINLKSWLKDYSDQIEYAIDNLSETSTSSSSTTSSIYKSKQKTSSSTIVVQPLLGNIAYNQDVPYNDSCPSYSGTKTVTGCVATAMAQVMRYYQYPTQGVGSNSYTTSTYGFNLSVDFGSTTYDWVNMLTSYDDTETNAEKAAVAQLMYHVGVSVDMNYDLATNGGSGAVMSKCANALYDNFSYDAGVQSYKRSYFSKEDWEAKIKTELNASRPVLYSGSSTSGGHAFVCDGYDDNDMFHINWGWGGSSNGYFELSALNPSNQGIGSSNGGYNLSQSIVAGIQKPISGSVHSQVLGVDSVIPSAYIIDKTSGTVDIKVDSIFNIGRFTYSGGSLKLGLYDSSDNLVYISTKNLADLDGGIGYYSLTFNNLSFSSYSNGTYTLKLLYKNEYGNYVPVLENRGGNNYLNVEITDTQVLFTRPTNSPVLNLTSSPTTSYSLYQTKKGEFQMSITNSGAEEYYAQIGIKLVKTDDAGITQEVVTSLAQISAGETKSFSIGGTISVDPGDYYLEVFYDSNNNESSTDFPDTQMGPSSYIPTVTVYPTPITDPALSIVGTPSYSTSIVQGTNLTITATIQNTGGFFDNKLIAFIFPSTGGHSLTYIGYQSAILDANTSNVFTFDGTISLNNGDYFAKIYYGPSSDWTAISNNLSFTVTENPFSNNTDISTSNTFKIIQNPVVNILSVLLPNNSKQLSIYSLTGKLIKNIGVENQESIDIPVNQLYKGVYLLVLKTNNEQTKTEKFIKN